MAKYAIVTDNKVENVIIIDPDRVEEMAKSLGKELVDASPYGLTIGDWREIDVWKRNIDGENVTLTERPTYDELLAALKNAGVSI